MCIRDSDETSFDLEDVLALHRRTGVRVVYDHHHHRCNPAEALREPVVALAAALETWPHDVRPKVHLSSPRTELRSVGGRGKDARLVAPLLDQHADFVTPWDLLDVLALHGRTGVRVVYDHHHHRCHPGELDVPEALAAAAATWGDLRPEVHLSSPRTELRTVGRGRAARLLPPLVDQPADFVTPWDLAELLRLAPSPVDVMLEAKAKDLALLWLREQLARIAPEAAAADERFASPRKGEG